MDHAGIGDLGPASPNSSEQPRRISRLLLLWPLADVVATFLAVITYKPLDEMLIWWISAIPCLICYALINIGWRRAQSGEGVPSYFPRTVWLATGCLFVPLVLLVNGALDRSPIEQHRQTINRTILERRRRYGSVDYYYYLEVSSWRRYRVHEKVMVSPRKYLESKVGDPVIVETHSGALGIPLLVSVHRPD